MLNHSRAESTGFDYDFPIDKVFWFNSSFKKAICFLGILLQSSLPSLLADTTWTDIEEPIEEIEEGMNLTSNYLEKGGILPIPKVISDPALGYGGALLGVKFHELPDSDSESEQLVPPSVSFGGGLYTENGTWGILGGHFHSFNNDDFRYLGIVGYSDFFLDYYFFDPDSGIAIPPLDYNLKMAFTHQEISKKISKNTSVGIRYLFLGTTSVFDLSNIIPPIDPIQFDSNSAGLGIKLAYDTRDNIMSPSKGTDLELKPYYFSESFGGDFDYWKVGYVYNTYLNFEPFILGIRLEGAFADDNTPFYHIPYVKQRGVPSMRYQGTSVLATEIELQYLINDSWRFLVFGGIGFADIDYKEFSTDQQVEAAGAGFRYLLSEQLGLQAGLDYAVSEGDSVVYVTIGSPW